MTDYDLFTELQQIRRDKNISLEQLSEELRIQMKYLKALDSGDILKIPEVYDKLFFRAYIQALGLGDEYFDRFMDIRKELRIDKTTSVINFISPQTTEKKLNVGKNILVIIPLVAVVLLIWIMIQNTENISVSSQQPVEEITIQSVVEDMENSQEIVGDTVQPVVSQPQLLNLKIGGLKRTWFRVVIDRQDTMEYLLQQGNQVNLVARSSFEFLIGRADGLELNINGSDLDPIGNDSSVVQYLKIDSTGISAKRIRRISDL